MSYDLSVLEPKIVWKYFDRIRQIPRGSGNETALAEAVLAWADEKGAKGVRDRVGNVIVKIPATSGFENVPGIVLQCHLDMVCEKNLEKEFDFTRDAIEIERDGEWITASGTTLGADNGIGLATALAFLEMEDLPHGPIEILATVEEENGLVGALGLEAPLIDGRMLFNLDSEEDGIFYVGCAGGLDSLITMPINRVHPPKDGMAYDLTVSGLSGGHSGLDIILNRGNAVVLLTRALQRLRDDTSLFISSIRGGDKHNAIPREAVAQIVTTSNLFESAKATLEEIKQGFLEEFGASEPNLELRLTKIDLPKSALSPETTQTTLDLISALPNGVMTMIRDVPGVVETSNNLASVTTEEISIKILCSSRSSVGSAIDGIRGKLEAICRLASVECKILSSYPGWRPNMKSEMLARAKAVWKDVHGREPQIQVVHAGLECGIIGEKFDEMDMISIGPTIENPHSPFERVHIPSVERFFTFAKTFVVSVANG